MRFKSIGHRMALGSFAGGLCAFAATTAAWAQEASSQVEALEVIVVTAQRRSELLQSVPIQVAAFSAAKIEDAGIKSTRDFVALVPNVSFDEGFAYLGSTIAMRGVSQLNNGDSPVAIVVDGVPQNSQRQQRMNLFDVERIEVLKGPQGGIYGRNAIGGAINIITKAPADHFEGFVESTYARGNALDVAGGVSMPVSDDAGLRLSASYKTDDGRIENTFTGKETDFIDHDLEVRGKLAAALTDRIQVDVRAAYRDFEGFGPMNVRVPSGRADDYRLPRSNLGGISFGDIFDASGKIDIDVGGATLTSISAYTDLEENFRGDGEVSNLVDDPGGFAGLGFGTAGAQDLQTTLKSQELRLVSDDDQPLRWILGAYYLETSRLTRTVLWIDTDGTYNHIDDPAVQLFDGRESDDNSAYAGYVNLDYDIGDHVTLSGAVRYDYDQRRKAEAVTGSNRTAHFSSTQPKGTITYKFTPERLVYATYSQGFRSGGFNSPFTPLPTYEAEELENYEIGFKTSWLSNRLLVNGAVYRAYDENLQYFFFQPPAFQMIANIDRVRLAGVELDVQALVAPGLQVFASVGTNDTKILRNRIDPSVIGNKTPRAQPWTTNVGFQYERPLSNTLGFMMRLDYQHRSRRYWQADNLDVQEPLDMVDARVGLQADRWSIFAFGRNLLDEEYYVEFGTPAATGFPVPLASLGQPATYGVEMRYEF